MFQGKLSPQKEKPILLHKYEKSHNPKNRRDPGRLGLRFQDSGCRVGLGFRV